MTAGRLQNKKDFDLTDDVDLIKNKKKIKFINGEINNNKITIKSDFETNNSIKLLNRF